MSRFLLMRLLLLFALVPGFISAAESWNQLKIGMTSEQAALKLGDPLIRYTGMGFELWIYDHQAEALFYGPLIGWTSPVTGRVAGRSVDIWQPVPGAPAGIRYFLPRPVLYKNPATRRTTGPESADRLPTYRQRR